MYIALLDQFRIACFSSLGDLEYLRIRQDSSGRGSYRSWYLNKVVVVDCQTRAKYPFVVNRWLSADRDDGLVKEVYQIHISDFNFGPIFAKCHDQVFFKLRNFDVCT